MSAKAPQRRSVTARELAERLGSSVRTAQRLVAEPRDDFETRARERRERAARLRNAGWSYKEIADDMEISTGAVGALLHIARREGLLNRQPVKRAG
ncbi:replication protein RepB [Nocardia sp. NPDC052001]|uniref:replication protein RepB n=1 Tax=Nocardia sp. NPDC052001 TaxID=3154853 RepID=UPI00342542B5